jgi:hypothetical protein
MHVEQQASRSDLGRALAALRRQVTQTCPVCKRPYEGAAHKRYCSAACRQRAYRERRETKEEKG